MVHRSEIQDRLKSELDIKVNEDEVKLPENRAASECLGQVADFLFVNGYLELDDLPIKSGHKRYLVNTKPKHQSGDKMFRPKPIAQGLYVETNYNKDGIKRKIEDLIRISSNK